MPDAPKHAVVVQAQGHLIDSQLLNTIFDTVIERGAAPALFVEGQQRLDVSVSDGSPIGASSEG